MSRIGNQLINVPSGVTATVTGHVIRVKGPKGELEQSFDPDIKVEVKFDYESIGSTFRL